MGDAFIYDAVRTPRGKGKSSGSLYTTHPVQLLAQCLEALEARNELDTSQVDDIVAGVVTQTGDQGSCIARTASMLAGYDVDAPGVTVNRFCGSGLEAVNHAASMVASGYFDMVIGGGVESMSRVKMGSDGGAMFEPMTQWAVGAVPQGISGDLLATLRGFTRHDADSFALGSQERAANAIEKGYFTNTIIPVKDQNGLVVLDQDEHPRAGTTLEGLGKLRASFEMMGQQFALDELTKRKYPEVERINHVHTAGNSSGIVDGAAAVIVANEAKGRELGLKPRARIRSVALAGSEPILMLAGPIPSTYKALKKAGMSASDIDLWEINEAFAAVPLTVMQEFGVDRDKVNIDGGAIALGHPLGATGAMLLSTLLDSMEREDKNTGLVTLCIGGGMGITTIIERV